MQDYTVSIPQKILFCFLLSAFLFVVAAALAIAGIFDFYAAEIPMLVAVFLTLFLMFFLCFNLRQDSTGETRAPVGVDEEKTIIRQHLPEVSFLNDHEYETLEELEAVVDEIVQLEAVGGLGGSVSLFKPFSFSSGIPDLLQGDESPDDGTAIDVFYEQNGIHYINSNAFMHDNIEKLDSEFAELVESVVNKY